ncbi:helix-turn-helix domain-containing protein [Kribbella sp. NPDC006257]|uniref:TetR/AcrR family transcriptional regulator n=1 Tax=Kribbella sp. NPDC006257 TaxID=3156738 RepID=UPI0033A54E50
MPLRVDARRNLEQLLAAAGDLVAEKGAGVALDEVAQRAGVGIATLYRRFPDRTALLRGVVLHSLDQTRTAAERAAEEHDDAFEALAAYLRAALELRVAAVIPLVLDVLDLNEPELAAAREASARATEELVDAAHASGQLPEDVTFADVGMMLVRIARPLPGPLPDELKHELARRHLELFVRGLGRRGDKLVGPALSRDGLAQMALRDAESLR